MHNDGWAGIAHEKRDGQGLATLNHLRLDGYLARQIRVPVETYYLSAWRPKDESQVPDPRTILSTSRPSAICLSPDLAPHMSSSCNTDLPSHLSALDRVFDNERNSQRQYRNLDVMTWVLPRKK